MATELKNSALEKMRANHLALGVLLRQARTVETVGAMAACGFDWIFLDLEHGTMPLDTVAQISYTAQKCGIAPIVRVPIMDVRLAARAMDNGALGVIMPRVETADQARHIAASLRYPPMGHRGVIGTLPHFDFKAPPVGEATRQMDAANLIVLLIETPEAVANIEEIAAVEGVDVLLVGGNDLTLEMGIPGQYTNPQFRDAVAKVAGAAQRHGKFSGLGGVYDPETLAGFLSMGMRFIVSGADISFMLAGAQERANFLRKLDTPA
jgi:4-hydroxy-2-oxoheptanedioate aldolase